MLEFRGGEDGKGVRLAVVLSISEHMAIPIAMGVPSVGPAPVPLPCFSSAMFLSSSVGALTPWAS